MKDVCCTFQNGLAFHEKPPHAECQVPVVLDGAVAVVLGVEGDDMAVEEDGEGRPVVAVRATLVSAAFQVRLVPVGNLQIKRIICLKTRCFTILTKIT